MVDKERSLCTKNYWNMVSELHVRLIAAFDVLVYFHVLSEATRDVRCWLVNGSR